MGAVTVTLTGDESRALKALDRLMEKERELARQGKETAKVHADGSEAVAAGIEHVIGKVTAWGLVLEGVKKGYDQIAAAQERAKQIQDDAARGLERDADSMRKLAQFTGGGTFAESGRRLEELQGEAKRVSSALGLTPGQGADRLASVLNVGIGAQGREELLVKSGRIGLDPQALASAAALQQSFGRGTSAEAIKGVLGGALGAALPGQGGELLQSAARLAGSAQAENVSEEQLVAMIAQVSQSMGSTEQGAHAVGSLFEHAKGRGLGGLFRMSDRALQQRVGGRGLAAVRALRGGLRGVNLGDASAFENMVSGVETNGTLMNVDRLRTARSAQEQQNEEAGNQLNLIEAEKIERANARRASGQGEGLNQFFSGHEDPVAALGEQTRLLNEIAHNTGLAARNGRPRNVDPSRDK